MTSPDWPTDDVTLDALSGPWRIHQRKKGHRWSVDDLLTAYVACTAAPSSRTHLDLGCGIGSVLMLVAYHLRSARHVGVEAQAQSAALCEASLHHNGLRERVTLRHADFRTPEALGVLESFDLITGTPPYLPVGTATMPRDVQKAGARMELRGGVEAYCVAGAAHLADGGTLVLCADGRTPQRTEQAARAVGLSVHARLDLVPLPGKPTLLHVVTLRRETSVSPVVTTLLARTEGRKRTRELQAIRAFFDMPPMPGQEEEAG